MSRPGTWWMRCLTTSLALVLWMGVWPCAQAERHSLLLDGDWQFQRQDVTRAAEPDVDTADWQTVRLPHTWNSPDAERGGAYYRGVGWYRHVFEWQGQADAGRQQFLEFDAATLAAEVWINGQRRDSMRAAIRASASTSLLGCAMAAMFWRCAWTTARCPMWHRWVVISACSVD